MSLLESYMEDGENLESLMESLVWHMGLIKEEAESLEYRWVTDEAFQHQIASLCLAVDCLKHLVLEAGAGIERFVQNTFKKWRTYTELQHDMLRLLSAKTIEAASRLYRVDRASNFNVIKVGAHHIELQHTNKALVPPSTPLASLETTKEPPPLEIFQSPSSLEQVVMRATDIISRFAEAHQKVRVYQAHYERLGNLAVLEREHALLNLKLDAVACYVEETILMEDNGVIRQHINAVNTCFKEMRVILEKECVNCRQYVINTIDRFMESSMTYKKLLAHFVLYKIQMPCLREDAHTEPLDMGCCSMYQGAPVSNNTMS